MCEYDFSNLREPFVAKIPSYKKHVCFFISFLIVMNLLVFLTTDELTYEIAIFPLFTIFIIALFYWLFSSLVYKIRINENEMTIEQKKKLIKIRWSDIEHIFVGRIRWTGPTTMKIKLSNADIKLPRASFQLYVGAGSIEGKKLLAKLLKKIKCYTELRCNKTIQQDIRKWDNEDNSGNF